MRNECVGVSVNELYTWMWIVLLRNTQWAIKYIFINHQAICVSYMINYHISRLLDHIYMRLLLL